LPTAAHPQVKHIQQEGGVKPPHSKAGSARKCPNSRQSLWLSGKRPSLETLFFFFF